MKQDAIKELEKDIHLKEITIKHYRDDNKRILKDYEERIDYNNSEIKRLQKEVDKLAKKLSSYVSKNSEKLK